MAVFSLALHSGHERTALEPFFRSERIRVASWLPSVAEKAAGPNVDPQNLGLAILPDLVLEDVGPGIAAEHGLP